MVFCEPASSAMSTMVSPTGDAGLAGGAEIVEVAGHLVEFLRADDQVDVGQLVEQRGAAVLRHAAEDAEDEVAGCCRLRCCEVAGLADGLLLGQRRARCRC